MLDVHPDKVFISPDELATIIDGDHVRIVDGSWYLDPTKNAEEEYHAAHIPGAVFFDLDKVADAKSSLPHMLPSPDQFAEAVGALGIGERDQIIVYDGPGLFSAARVWWTFKIMGALHVQILEGGLSAWKRSGHTTSSRKPDVSPVVFNATFQPDAVINLEELKVVVRDGTSNILDARPSDRFYGRAPEPRQGLASGHMPGALNVPINALIEDGRLRSPSELQRIFADFGLSEDDPIVTTCGSGVTAAVIALALHVAGYENVRLYDGSWAEWGSAPGVPIDRE